jgi:hypothetical protein
VWFEEGNHLLCRPDPQAVAAAVEEMTSASQNGSEIGRRHIERAREFRSTFVSLTARLGLEKNSELDWEAYLGEHYHHRMVNFRLLEEVLEELRV